jgi:YfiH family protein
MADHSTEPFNRPDGTFNTLAGWTWIGCYGGYFLQCDQLADFEHGFFTRLWQGRPPEVLAGYLSAGVSVHRTRQVHGNTVLLASKAVAEPWPEADALVSDQGGQSLWVCGADCTPVLIADRASGQVASCHAGWRGVASRILPATIAILCPDPERRGDLVVALGPAVSGHHYQVETAVAAEVAQTITALDLAADKDLAQMKSSGVVLDDPAPDHLRLDIRRAARLQIEASGVPRANIHTCPLCTFSEPELFHSWRRDQVKAVQWSGIVSQAGEFSEDVESLA